MAARHRLETAAGTLHVWLPSGETLDELDGLAYWSPDPRLGRFTVTKRVDGDGDELLAAEREHGDVEIEADERQSRGGASVRRLRYRVRRSEPREAVLTERGRMHGGGEVVDHLSDTLLIGDGDHAARAGYSVRADAPAALRATFAELLDRLLIVSER